MSLHASFLIFSTEYDFFVERYVAETEAWSWEPKGLSGVSCREEEPKSWLIGWTKLPKKRGAAEVSIAILTWGADGWFWVAWEFRRPLAFIPEAALTFCRSPFIILARVQRAHSLLLAASVLCISFFNNLLHCTTKLHVTKDSPRFFSALGVLLPWDWHRRAASRRVSILYNKYFPISSACAW